MKKVFKYATGQEVPDGAVYCSTVTQTEIETGRLLTSQCRCHDDFTCSDAPSTRETQKCWLVWHYFLVEVKE